jgi:hypothetical protein
MVLKILFLHFYKVIEALGLRLLFHAEYHFSHLLSFELVETAPVFGDHRVPIIEGALLLSSIIQYRSDETPSHLALTLNISLGLLIVLELSILHVFLVRLLVLRICHSPKVNPLR